MYIQSALKKRGERKAEILLGWGAEGGWREGGTTLLRMSGRCQDPQRTCGQLLLVDGLPQAGLPRLHLAMGSGEKKDWPASFSQHISKLWTPELRPNPRVWTGAQNPMKG